MNWGGIRAGLLKKEKREKAWSYCYSVEALCSATVVDIYRTHAVNFENLRCKMFLKRNQWRAIWSLIKRSCQSIQKGVKKQNHVIPLYIFNPVPFSCLHPTTSLFPLLLCLSLSTSLHFHKSPKTGSCHLTQFSFTTHPSLSVGLAWLGCLELASPF